MKLYIIVVVYYFNFKKKLGTIYTKIKKALMISDCDDLLLCGEYFRCS